MKYMYQWIAIGFAAVALIRSREIDYVHDQNNASICLWLHVICADNVVYLETIGFDYVARSPHNDTVIWYKWFIGLKKQDS